MEDTLFSVRDRVAVITGATGLIGRAISRGLVERGAKLLLVDVAGDPVAFARDLGRGAEGLICNVSDATEVKALTRAALDRFGRIDVLVNSHQYKPTGFLTAQAEDFPEELWDSVVDVNLKGAFLTCRDVGRQMLAQGSGSIINFASTYGVVSSNPDLYEGNSLGNPVAYTASKSGVIGMTRYLGAYWASRGVRVNCVTPHGVWNHHEPGFEARFSKMSPMKRMMRDEEVLGAIVFLASDASSYVTGSNLLVEGGWTAW